MIVVKPTENQQELDFTHQIRRTVFVVEQNCPEDIEWEYEEESKHFIALVDGVAAGTARWRQTDKGYKLERFAVLKPYRNKEVGATILKYLLADVPNDDKTIYLHAQLAAKNFYLRHGFKPKGEHFWEGGIEHVMMEVKR
jgi:predicted GNAT family N-acyltransferase